MRISTEIGSRFDADVIPEAEGSIRQQPLREGVLKSAVSLARGMFPKRLAGNPRELPISSHTKRNASYIGRYVIPRVDRRDHGEMASSLMTP